LFAPVNFFNELYKNKFKDLIGPVNSNSFIFLSFFLLTKIYFTFRLHCLFTNNIIKFFLHGFIIIFQVAKERVEKYFEDPEDELAIKGFEGAKKWATENNIKEVLEQISIYEKDLPAPIHHLHQPEGFQLNKLCQLVYI
jgi:hypothetical protein